MVINFTKKSSSIPNGNSSFIRNESEPIFELNKMSVLNELVSTFNENNNKNSKNDENDDDDENIKKIQAITNELNKKFNNNNNNNNNNNRYKSASVSYSSNLNLQNLNYNNNNNIDDNNSIIYPQHLMNDEIIDFLYDSNNIMNKSTNSQDEEIIGQEEKSDCIYVIKFKKIYNKNLQNNNNNSNSNDSIDKKPPINPNGIYRPLPNEFRSYINEDNNNNNNILLKTQNDTNNNNKSAGLIYSKKKIKILKYASLSKLIEHLINLDTGELDINLIQTFLATYRTFTDTKTAIESIKYRYEQVKPASLEMTEEVRVAHMEGFKTIIRLWLNDYIEDFDELENLDILYDFCKKYLKDCIDIIKKIELKYKEIGEKNNNNNEFNNLDNNSSKPSSSSSSSTSSQVQSSVPSINSSLINEKEGGLNLIIEDDIVNKTEKIEKSPIIMSYSSNSGLTPNIGGSGHRRASSWVTLHEETSDLLNSTNKIKDNLRDLESAKPLLLALSPILPIKDDNNNNINIKRSNNSINTLNNNNNDLGSKQIIQSISSGRISASNSRSGSQTNLLNLNIFEMDFMSLDNRYFAEQLTYLDKCLFQSVYAHHCLAGVWNKRYNKNSNNNLINSQNTQNLIDNTKQSDDSNTVTSKLLNNSGISKNGISNSNLNVQTIITDKFAPMKAFIDQFNLISFMVQSTILENLELKPSSRAKIIEKWIRIASLCKKLKNFSSLNAIVQGLNITCISRLEKTWGEVSVDASKEFSNLTEMFSEDQNQKILREILNKELNRYRMVFEEESIHKKKIAQNNVNNYNNTSNDSKPPIGNMHHRRVSEGISKLNENLYKDGINATLGRKTLKDLLNKHNKNEQIDECGIIPFLGTFLKDLEYTSALGPHKNEKGLINVELKQKEYELISQIKLFQKASHMYSIIPDKRFKTWLYNQPIYSETQNYELSKKIEPPNSNIKEKGNKNRILFSFGNQLGSTDSLNSLKDFKNSPSTHSKDLNKNNNNNHSRSSSYGSNADIFNFSNFNNNPMITSQQSYSSSNGGGDLNGSISSSNHQQNNDIRPSPLSSSATLGNCSNKQIIKVSLDYNASHNHHHGFTGGSQLGFRRRKNTNESIIAETTMYKHIHLTDKDRTKDVKRNILQKFLLDPDTFNNYQLLQICTNSNNNNKTELPINDNCNVYYAMKKEMEMEFLLRRKDHQTNNNNNINNNGTSSSNIPRTMSSKNKMGNLPPQSPNHQFRPSSLRRLNSRNSGESPSRKPSWSLFKNILNNSHN